MLFLVGAQIIGNPVPCENLRHSLRSATDAAHDLLDSSMRAAAGWTTQADYKHFLSLQHAARLPVEQWLSSKAPASLCPPPQCPQIELDLLDLGETVPQPSRAFDLPLGDGARRDAQVLGVAWVLAGSSLGNKAILGEVRRTAKANGSAQWPTRFLSDLAMLDFWKRLRPLLENSAGMEEVELASSAASAVFDHFIAHTQTKRAGTAGLGIDKTSASRVVAQVQMNEGR